MTQTLDTLRNLFSFSSMQNLSVSITDDNLFRISKKDNETFAAMKLPVNNYLKTPEEIEKELQYTIDSHKDFLTERKKILSHQNTSISNTDDYMSIPNAELVLSGFMEENY